MLRSVTSNNWPAEPGALDSPAMILLHGYGSHEHDLVGLTPLLPAGMPWASLRAPLEMDFGGSAWFPLDFIDGPGGDGAGADDAAAATASVWQWVDHHLGESARIVPFGFSQGGFMALQLLRTRPDRVVSTVTLAGFTTLDPQPADDVVKRTRPEVFWGRGKDDQVVPADRVLATKLWLANNVAVEERTYKRLAHGINEEMMSDVQAFLARTVPSPQR